ncbi:uncharacterized protein LAESUDRAFT_639698 [Laetiporus sulphureus 93-53]|uniref:Uncharacterized protein n=1 Tax=Laetiporus sulphureus 93-53 TaxID=1314785 RepID=A0A165IGF9_9APHY|nr:uncharacterized protein LAESUDRAFT_639698 [Laetiporus sulphureus 93-53]KZT13038.1 hypothetical protein LAESUDRAFT_639698 [Laetiporus sulphureus 93-53]
MNSAKPSFLFALPGSKKRRTARKVHIRRLFDVLQLCILRNDLSRGRRAWAILLQCKEVKWKSLWQTAVFLLGEREKDDLEFSDEMIALFSTKMRQHPEQRETILKELILQLIQAGMHREALDELDLYLPSFPYQGNPVLQTYAGLLALYLAQPQTNADAPQESSALLRDAQFYFERAKAIDPKNAIAMAFIEQMPMITQHGQQHDTSESDSESQSDDEGIEISDIDRRHKRART